MGICQFSTENIQKITSDFFSYSNNSDIDYMNLDDFLFFTSYFFH